FVERFRREASSAAALSHPNIVGIFDRGEWNGTYYIAMEYVAGRSLKTIVREQGPLEPAMAIEIVIQILRAARFAHRRGVIHRDLTPPGPPPPHAPRRPERCPRGGGEGGRPRSGPPPAPPPRIAGPLWGSWEP